MFIEGFANFKVITTNCIYHIKHSKIKNFYLIHQCDVGGVIKSPLSSNTELSKTTLLNSDLLTNKILDINPNVNKINREIDENNDNNLKIAKI